MQKAANPLGEGEMAFVPAGTVLWVWRGQRVCKYNTHVMAGTSPHPTSSVSVLISECTKPHMRDLVCLQERGLLRIPYFSIKLLIANSASALLPEGKEQSLVKADFF